MYKNILILLTAASLFTACGGKEEKEWTSFIYPDKQNTKRSLKSPVTFESLEECKKQTQEQIDNNNLTNAFYKCGLNCSFHDGMKLEICQEMHEFK